MLSGLAEKAGVIEVMARLLFDRHPKLKKKIKRARKADNNVLDRKSADGGSWDTYRKRIQDVIGKDDIVLIHSSMDGLTCMGIDEKAVIDFLNRLVEQGNTIVIPTFPITNLKIPDENSKPYDPQKTICWTGMLPNMFLRDKDTVRSTFPYNSLAAKGPKAKEMMTGNLDAEYVYGKNSAWDYCFRHRAKILFLGTKASGSNTMAIHMIPDVMGSEWPIDQWYEKVAYKVKIDGKVISKTIKVQKGFWYKFCMEERTSGRLKETGILREEYVAGCYFGYIRDSYEMVSELIALCRRNRLMYLVPHKYYKKN